MIWWPPEPIGHSSLEWVDVEQLTGPPTEKPSYRNIAPELRLNVTGLSGGIVIEDFNNDQLLDVMVSSWGALRPTLSICSRFVPGILIRKDNPKRAKPPRSR